MLNLNFLGNNPKRAIMSIPFFLLRVRFDKICPWNVNASRWAGMLKWLESRTSEGYSFQELVDECK